MVRMRYGYYDPVLHVFHADKDLDYFFSYLLEHDPDHLEHCKLVYNLRQSKSDYYERIFPLLLELSKELDIEVSDEDVEAFYQFERNKRTLYRLYPDRDKIKRRMRTQLLLRRYF